MSSAKARVVMYRSSLALLSFMCVLGMVVPGLCAATVLQQNPQQTSSPTKSHPKVTPAKSKVVPLKPLTEQQRALHALNRFTFGPRPGDVDLVMKMGTDAWFEQQLDPASIKDAALDKRLGDYPSLNLSTPALLNNLPTEQMVRQVQQGKKPAPQDAILAGVYEVLIAKFDIEKKKNDDAQKNAAVPLTPDQEKAQQDLAAAQKKEDQATAHALAEPLLDLPKNQRMAAIMKLTVADRIILTSNLQDPQKGTLIADFTPREREVFQEMAGGPRNATDVVAQQLMQAKLLRAVMSERQLQEVMTDFWFNHFNVFIYKDSDKYYAAAYERDAIRPHALGKFRDLLMATAQHPAMLVYLDNWLSIGPDSAASGKVKPGQKQVQPIKGLNENYGREVMELHTVGVNGGYTQADVTNLAKILTGWTVDHPENGGGFLFDPRRHEPGPKHWFGQDVSENGYQEGVRCLQWLAAQPQTAHFISYKLAQRFVADDPPPALVDRMTTAFLTSDGDIKEVLRTMYHAPEFWSPKVYRVKVKTPLEFIASAFRATDTSLTNPGAIVGTLSKMGQPLYQMLPPTGYPMTADHWMNSGALVDRLNFSLSLANSRIGGIKFDAPRLLAAGLLARPSVAPREPGARAISMDQAAAGTPSGADEAIDLMEATLIGSQVSDKTNAVIRKQLADAEAATPNDPNQNLDAITALVLGSPEFQLR